MPELTDDQEKVLPLKKDMLDEKQVQLWRNRAKTANKYHRMQIMEKYKVAKKRYNSEAFGYQKTKNKYTHETFNLLYSAVEDFNGSVYYKNPEIDLSARDTENPTEVRNTENLQQIVNDDIKDNRSLKAMMRAGLVDEQLASLAVFYIDYDYRTQDSNELIDPNNPTAFKQIPVSNKVRPCKILPENLIRPPFQTLYNYQESPYLGFVDIVSLECLKSDPTLDQNAVSQLKGKQYADLLDVDKEDMKKEDLAKDDLLFEKIFYIWIKGDDGGPLKRLVLSEDQEVKTVLAYEDWDRGNGPDDKGYPIHLLALNDPCDGFIPPSEAWKLEAILCTIDYLMSKMLKHLKRSRTRTLVKGGKDGMGKENISKWLKDEDLELISLNNLPPGLDIRALVHQIQDQELSADHNVMFDLCKRVFDELSRKPAFAQVAVQEKKKTATESEQIAQQDNSQGAYKVDKFKDFLVGFFYDWAKLTQKNMKDPRNITVKSKTTGEEEAREVFPQDLQAKFNVDINIETFVMPNRELKRRTIKEAIMDIKAMEPLLGGKKKLNGERVVMEYVNNLEVRDPEGFLIDVPVRNVDQQVLDLTLSGAPMSVEELGEDYQGALKRIMEIFADHEKIAKMEMMVPGIGGPDGPLAMMMRDLEALMQQVQGQQKPSQAKSDMTANAGLMAGAQA